MPLQKDCLLRTEGRPWASKHRPGYPGQGGSNHYNPRRRQFWIEERVNKSFSERSHIPGVIKGKAVLLSRGNLDDILAVKLTHVH